MLVAASCQPLSARGCLLSAPCRGRAFVLGWPADSTFVDQTVDNYDVCACASTRPSTPLERRQKFVHLGVTPTIWGRTEELHPYHRGVGEGSGVAQRPGHRLRNPRVKGAHPPDLTTTITIFWS